MILPNKNTSPVIIYRLGSLGDTIVALPCFHKIAEVYSRQEIIVLTNFPISSKAIPLEQILLPMGLIDRSIEYPLGARSFQELMRLRKKIKETGAKTLIYLNAGRGVLKTYRDILFFRFCGIKKIIGAPITTNLQNCFLDSVTGELEYEARRLARTMDCLGAIDLDEPHFWDLKFSDAEIKVASHYAAMLEIPHFFVINMGGKDPKKDWGQERWIKLLTALSRQNSPIGLVVVGASDDAVRANEVLNIWPFKKMNLCGLLSPRECAAVLSKASFFIGHDSGPLHLAACVKLRCLGIFGENNLPKRWHPYGKSHLIFHDIRGVDFISVNDVLVAAQSLIDHSILSNSICAE